MVYARRGENLACTGGLCNRHFRVVVCGKGQRLGWLRSARRSRLPKKGRLLLRHKDTKLHHVSECSMLWVPPCLRALVAIDAFSAARGSPLRSPRTGSGENYGASKILRTAR